jgi:fructose-bisphosphate aldolase class 1
MTDELQNVALAQVAAGKGILAADETPHRLARRFDALGIRLAEQSRCPYPEMRFTAGVSEIISDVIWKARRRQGAHPVDWHDDFRGSIKRLEGPPALE